MKKIQYFAAVIGLFVSAIGYLIGDFDNNEAVILVLFFIACVFVTATQKDIL